MASRIGLQFRGFALPIPAITCDVGDPLPPPPAIPHWRGLEKGLSQGIGTYIFDAHVNFVCDFRPFFVVIHSRIRYKWNRDALRSHPQRIPDHKSTFV